MTKRVTLKDIAKETGYSVNCVSRALMGASDISEDTKQKVRNVANAMGYIQNHNAATLRNGNTKTIGVLHDSLLNSWYSILIHYLEIELSKYGYTFLTFKSKCEMAEAEMVKNIISRNVDGLISFLEPDDDAAKLISMTGLPTVVVGRKAVDKKIDYLTLNDIDGGYLATKHLIDCGYKNILYLGGTKNLACSVERGIGYLKAIKEANLAEHSFYIEPAQDYEEIIPILLDGKLDFDSIFCYNDFTAFIVITELEKHNIKDIGIVGFDNLQDEIKMPCRLTTVGYDKKTLANQAINILFARMQNNLTTNTASVLENIYLVEGTTTKQKK